MKNNRITDVTKILIMAASIFITCSLVFAGMRAAQSAKKIGNAAEEQIQDLYKDISESGITRYHNAEVYGSDVINFIKKYLGEYIAPQKGPFTVNVITSNGDFTYQDNTYIADISDFTKSQYIKQTAKFKGSVIRNANDVIVTVRFTQY